MRRRRVRAFLEEGSVVDGFGHGPLPVHSQAAWWSQTGNASLWPELWGLVPCHVQLGLLPPSLAPGLGRWGGGDGCPVFTGCVLGPKWPSRMGSGKGEGWLLLQKEEEESMKRMG